jgi:DNA-binding MarR family transcriptional regulator
VRLKKIVDATEGNLGAHIQTLEEAGYVEVQKDFADNRPRTRVRLSRDGRAAFEDYVAFLRGILEG